ncbi:MAG: PEGA domain-containing protein [Candidatus Latescibacteria bacterium]|nr:PEGA domain-containing protein [Candidatus Latescibacterota bacterium]
MTDQVPFTPIRQPYSVGAPVRDRAIFFGRQDDFTRIRERLLDEREGMVLSLVGPRRSGKTSIMFQILNGELGPEFLPVFIDMQQMASVQGDREFFSRLAGLVLENLKDKRLAPEYYNFDEGNPALIFDGLLIDIQQGHPDRRLLFLIDEAEILESKVTRQELSAAVLPYLSSILENRQTSFCLTGSPGMIAIESEEWRRLVAKGDYLEISFLTRPDSHRLIEEPVAGQVEYADGVAESIYQLTAGWPFYIQLTCFYLVLHLNHEQRHRASADDIVEVVRAIVDNPPPQIVYQWDELDPAHQISLALVGELSNQIHQAVGPDDILQSIKDNNYPLELKTEGIRVALEELYASKHLERTAEGAYFFRVDLFRQWVRRYRSVWRLVGQSERGGKAWQRWAGAGVVVGLAALGAWWGLKEPAAPPAPAPGAPAATTGQVWVMAQRNDLQVLVDGAFRHDGTPTLVRSLAPGPHTVRVEHPDYHPQEQQLVVRAGHMDTVRLLGLERRTGTLKATVNPSDAQVFIVGEVDTALTAPIAALDLPTGHYQVTTSRPGYVNQSRQIEITSYQQTQLSLDLQARIGGIALSSDPPGAQVFMDGKVIEGRTPLVLEKIAEGQHTFRFELPQYHPQERVVRVARGGTAELALQLVLLPASLTLHTQPPGAEIRLDGADSLWGRTPATITFVPGAHQIELSHPGYDPHRIEGQWLPDQHADPPLIELARQYGYARIARPLSGELYANGEFVKKGLLGNIRFPVGDYTLRIGAQQQQIGIYKDSTVVVRFE